MHSHRSEMEKFSPYHLFVPGNHDPAEMYDCKTPSILPKLETGTTNMHNHCVKLADHLWLVGFGGSVPRRLRSGAIDRNGYPFETTDMGNEITSLFSLIPKGDQVILMTHCPPDNVGSSFVDEDHPDAVFYLGSTSMYNQVCELMRDVGTLGLVQRSIICSC